MRVPAASGEGTGDVLPAATDPADPDGVARKRSISSPFPIE
jgi:hypothetical protein